MFLGKNNGDRELIVSLTSYGCRVNSVALTIESIFQQTVKPNRIILWLSSDEFLCLEDLPYSLRKLQERGLDILFCEDIRSFKKLIPTIKLYPEADILTIDDDVLYPRLLISVHFST